MNKKQGFTLAEVIAVLVVLSIIAVIVTPNIAVNLRDYRSRLYETQLNSIREASKNWATDHIDQLPTDGSGLLIYVDELQSEGYIDDDLKNPKDGSKFKGSGTFALIVGKKIVDETESLESNYSYKYGAYASVTDYLERMAIEYTKDNNNITQTVTKSEMADYLATSIKDTKGNNIAINDATVLVEVSETDNGEYKYETSITN